MKKIIIFALFAVTLAVAAAEIEFDFKSSYDGSTQKAAGFVPDDIASNKTPRPLLMIAHFMGGDRYTAKRSGYYEAAAKRGWLVAAPELHGKNTDGKTSCSALEAQHDMIDAMNYMTSNYPVDKTRVYVAGRSMGGMLTAIMLAKYPDIFAAGVAGQGCYDMTALNELAGGVEGAILRELGDDPFEAPRRSAANYAGNLATVPIIMWHGGSDGLVAPAQSERLFEAIAEYQKYIRPVFYIANSGHLNQNVGAEWICDQLLPYQMTSDAGLPVRWNPSLNIVTDEAKKFFYLDITPKNPAAFAKVECDLTGDFDRSPQLTGCKLKSGIAELNIRTSNVAELGVDLDLIPADLRPQSFKFERGSDTPDKFYTVSGGKKTERLIEFSKYEPARGDN
ncbi:MAG: prolyl oligopeptidase family serine peptidase [Victivallaceae bacterium]|nr:prolyl oligopeptidase family serine peptidase [Victivallaceae bacterium]